MTGPDMDTPVGDDLPRSEYYRLWEAMVIAIGEIVLKHDVPPGWLLNAKYKGREMVAARKELAALLRERVRVTCYTLKGIDKWRIISTTGGSEGKPLSTPLLAKCLGMNHSTFVLHAKEAREALTRYREDKPQETTP